MRELVIATGLSRREKKWKNVHIKWEQLVNKLANTTRTPETFKHYLSLSKTKQGDIKDVGGFVGGSLKDGRRSASTINFRDLLTLDIDNIPGGVDVWFNFTMLYDATAACVYSTHKHQPKAPRLRLIIPLSRSVSPDEYEAISRWVAKDVGIDFFDDTTYEPSRLMYWPSTSVDAEYYYQVQDGAELDADKILANYVDWLDVTSWPYSSRVDANAIRKTADKAEDPLAKEGIIGAFCRTYSISDVIELYLNDIYQPTNANDRYSYVHGSTSGGLVVYSDKFAYSHHSTDPAGGRLLNAFDLVRIHKFANLDDGKEDSKQGALPSFKAMNDFASKLADVKREIGSEFAAKAEDFEVITEDVNWFEKLDLSPKKEILPTYNNIELILENDPNLKGMLSFNEMSGIITLMRPTPWREGSKPGDWWSDADDTGLESYIERTYNISASKKIKDSVVAVQNRHRFHPIKRYLEDLPVWDGTPRAEALLIDYLAADDTEYVRAVTKKTLAAAVKRIYNPGYKWDHMLTFTGAQGGGKSTLIGMLGKEWYSDSITTVVGKEGMEQLQGVWLGEMAELTATKRADVEAVKQFITKRSDDYRASYGKHKINRPRQCVLFGTTNNPEFLRDTSGNRRFLVVEIKGWKEAKLNAWEDLDVDQVWAEVLTFYDTEDLYIAGKLEEEAERIQKEHLEESPKAGMIREYLDRLLPEDWENKSLEERRAFIHNEAFGGPIIGTVRREIVCAQEVWCELFRRDIASLDRMTSREINDVINATEGWERVATIRFGDLYGRQRGYRRVETKLDEILKELI